jgi:two-component system response regulator YesN
VRYIEKPIDPAELQEAVSEAVKEVERIAGQSNNILHALLKMHYVDGRMDEKSMQMFDSYERWRDLRDDRYFVVALARTARTGADAAEIQEYIRGEIENSEDRQTVHFIADFLDRHTTMLITSTSQTDSQLSAAEDRLCRKLIEHGEGSGQGFIAQGSVIDSLTRMADSYETAMAALRTISYKGWDTFAHADETTTDYVFPLLPEQQNRMYQDLVERKTIPAKRFIRQIADEMIAHHSELGFNQREQFFSLNNTICQARKALSVEAVEDGRQPFGQFLDEASTIEEVCGYLFSEADSLLEDRGTEDRKNSVILSRVREIIEKSYTDKNLTIQMIAERAFLSPTYMSAMYKKKTGHTVGEYLTDLRIEKACELLRDPGYKLYQVTGMVGYEDPNYFAKIFKKKVGMLPSAYREKEIL